MDLNQKLIDRAMFSNFKTLEEIKEKIKTFMLATTYNENYEDWTQRLENGVEIHHIQVFKFIIEVNEEEVQPNKNSLFKVSIYTQTLGIRYGGSLWNQFEFCLDALTEYLDPCENEGENKGEAVIGIEVCSECNFNTKIVEYDWRHAGDKLCRDCMNLPGMDKCGGVQEEPDQEEDDQDEPDIPWCFDKGKNAELDANLEALYNAETTMMEMTLSEPDYVRPDF